MAHLNRNIVEVKTNENSLAHALMIAIVRVTNDPSYKAYRQGWKILHKVSEFLQESGIDLSRGRGTPNYKHFSSICRNIG